MSNHLKVIGDAFALCNINEHVIGVVCKMINDQWQFVPLVNGKTYGANDYIPLRHALEQAIKFEAE